MFGLKFQHMSFESTALYNEDNILTKVLLKYFKYYHILCNCVYVYADILKYQCVSSRNPSHN